MLNFINIYDLIYLVCRLGVDGYDRVDNVLLELMLATILRQALAECLLDSLLNVIDEYLG